MAFCEKHSIKFLLPCLGFRVSLAEGRPKPETLKFRAECCSEVLNLTEADMV